MAATGDDSSSSGAATAAKLRDEALAAAKRLEDEAASLRSTNAERSQQLAEDAELLKSAAAAAQDRVRAAADVLEHERTQALDLEQRTTALQDCHRSTEPREDAPRDDEFPDDDNHSLSFDATTVARVHSQATAVQNIRNLISVTLDHQAPNYSKWRGYVLLILGRFALQDHVLADAPHLPDPAWSRMDCVVVSWLFNAISTDLLDVIHERNGVTV
jgi:hypothetical protein